MIHYAWEDAASEDYKTVPDSEDWAACKDCNERPRVWHFNYGKSARCRCQHKWDASPVQSESAGDVYRRDGNIKAYDHDALRLEWNAHCAAARPESPTPKGETR